MLILLRNQFKSFAALYDQSGARYILLLHTYIRHTHRFIVRNSFFSRNSIEFCVFLISVFYGLRMDIIENVLLYREDWRPVRINSLRG